MFQACQLHPGAAVWLRPICNLNLSFTDHYDNSKIQLVYIEQTQITRNYPGKYFPGDKTSWKIWWKGDMHKSDRNFVHTCYN